MLKKIILAKDQLQQVWTVENTRGMNNLLVALSRLYVNVRVFVGNIDCKLIHLKRLQYSNTYTVQYV